MKFERECQCPECKFERDVVRTVADIVEFIENSEACEQCKFEAAMCIFALGVEASELGFALSSDFDQECECDEDCEGCDECDEQFAECEDCQLSEQETIGEFLSKFLN